MRLRVALLIVALLVTSLAVEAEHAGKVYRLGILSATAGLGAVFYRCVGPGTRQPSVHLVH